MDTRKLAALILVVATVCPWRVVAIPTNNTELQAVPAPGKVTKLISGNCFSKGLRMGASRGGMKQWIAERLEQELRARNER